jgi:hypothetical protein
MYCVVRRAPGNSLAQVIVSLVVAAAFAGCNQGGSATRSDQLEQVSKLPSRVPVAKFAGRVSVDGQPSTQGGTLFVILNDPQHPVKGGKAFARCDEQGNFVFTTYLSGDGAPTGKYVVTFAQLQVGGGTVRGRGGVGRRPSVSRTYVSPDGLSNLYNDPDKNKDNPNFVVEIADPGRSDYEFNLPVAGKDPIKTPGQYAATDISTTASPKLGGS